ncbi:hypothetical protein [Nostoc sp.]|uniref:hypothetical protein n=1 Tax=Nostoc sp. TaxID=1180 RepID=UPI002FFC833C
MRGDACLEKFRAAASAAPTFRCGGLCLRYLTPEEKAEQERIRTEKLAWYLR